MKITMKTLYATPSLSIDAGRTAEVPDDVARDLIEKGFAVAADADPSTEDGSSAAAGAASARATRPAKKAAPAVDETKG